MALRPFSIPNRLKTTDLKNTKRECLPLIVTQSLIKTNEMSKGINQAEKFNS